AYRSGDSVVNIISPQNPDLLIVLAVMMKDQPTAGHGSLIALMVPYTLVFTLVWTTFLVAWYWLGLPLGPGAPLYYVPGS
ncbi:MAG: AbgT family transporter, partial [Pseudomonadota bacterium]